jgi:hypothetical protein
MLTEEQARKLRQLRGCYTRYEVEIALPDGRKMLICYTSQKTLVRLREVIREWWTPIARAAGLLLEEPRGMRDKKAYVFEDGSIIRYSGRTQRDAIAMGELPYIGPPEY